MAGFTKAMQQALEADGEKLRQMTGEDHGPVFDAGVECPVCGKPARFIEDDEDMGWYCAECHVAIETSADDLGD